MYRAERRVNEPVVTLSVPSASHIEYWSGVDHIMLRGQPAQRQKNKPKAASATMYRLTFMGALKP